MRKRAGIRATIQPRYWHTGVCVSAGALIFGMVDLIYIKNMGRLPGLMDIWWLAILLPLFCGAGITSGCGGAALWRRIAAAAVCGFLLALVYTAVSAGLGQVYGAPVNKIAVCLVWRGFIFTILSTLGTLLTELWLPEPNVLND
jgi:hypothetical protein